MSKFRFQSIYFYAISMCLVLLFSTAYLNAQDVLQMLWQSELSNSNGGTEKELSQTEASNGHAFVAGHQSTDLGQRMYLAGYSSEGVLDWEISLPSERESEVRRLVVNGDGDLYLAGVENVIDENEPSIHYARVDQNGEVIWHFTFDAEGGEEVEFSWMEVANNHLYLTGSEMGENGYEVAWAAEFDLDGNLNWKTTFDPGLNTFFADIHVNAQGQVAACGWGDYGYSFLLVGFGPDGLIEWLFPADLTGETERWFNDLSSDEEGNWIAVGTDEVGSFSEYDAVTYKIDPNGNEIWSRNFNNGEENYGNLVEVMPNGNILTVATIEIDFDNFVRLISHDADGNELWATNYAIQDDAYAVNIAVSPSGEIFVGVQDWEFSGFVKFSSDGALLNSTDYSEEVLSYLRDIDFDGNRVYGCGFSNSGEISSLIGLASDNLAEVFFESSTGMPTSDVQVSHIENDGEFIWIANTSDQSDQNVFSMTKLSYSGESLWSADITLSGSNPRFKDLHVDQSGNCIGFFENLITGGVTDLGLVKYDPNGNEVFALEFDSAAVLQAGAVTTDLEDNIYVGGYNQNSKLMFLSQYDPNGNEIWTVHYESASPTFPYAIPLEMKISEAGKLVIAAIHKNAANVNNLFLFQYNLDGTMEWSVEPIDQSGNLVFLNGFELDDNGEISLFGSSGVGFYMAARYDANGQEIWLDAGSLASTVAPRSMAIDPLGNHYLCFSSSTNARFRKLDPSGNLIQSMQHSFIDFPGYYFPHGAAFINDKLAIVGDFSSGTNPKPLEILLDESLNLIWGRVDEEYIADYRAMAIDASNNLHVAFVQGNTSVGTGFRTGLVRQYALGTLGIGERPAADEVLTIYPNPAGEEFYLTFSSPVSDIQNIELFDLSGRKVHDYGSLLSLAVNQAAPLTFPPNLNVGHYILRISTKDRILTGKVLKAER